jgi:hypothetical protein
MAATPRLQAPGSPTSAAAEWRTSRSLTREQKRVLRHPDGRIALDVLRHLLGARPMTPERFPLAEGAFQAVARKLGYLVGQKRCRRMRQPLVETGVIGPCGHCRQPYRNSARTLRLLRRPLQAGPPAARSPAARSPPS